MNLSRVLSVSACRQGSFLRGLTAGFVKPSLVDLGAFHCVIWDTSHFNDHHSGPVWFSFSRSGREHDINTNGLPFIPYRIAIQEWLFHEHN